MLRKGDAYTYNLKVKLPQGNIATVFFSVSQSGGCASLQEAEYAVTLSPMISELTKC